MRDVKKVICEKCNKLVSLSNYTKHLKGKGCNIDLINKKTIKIQNEWLQQNGLYKCPYCEKEYNKSGIGAHIWRKHTEEGENCKHDPNRGYKDGTKVAWNKGLTKDSDERVKGYGEKVSISLTGKSHKVSDETRVQISNTMKEKFKSGELKPTKGVGRGKKGWYKNYWCDCSWELAFIIYNLEHDIKFERNTKGFPYEFEDEIKNYFPDFIMEDGSYIEIKGQEVEKDICKWENFPLKLKILKYEEIKSYLEYVIKKYGRNFIELYDDYKISKKQLQQQEQRKINKQNRDEINNKNISDKINLILNSNINFSKFGWVNEAAKIINITPQNVGHWMKRNMLEFYNENCFKKKQIDIMNPSVKSREEIENNKLIKKQKIEDRIQLILNSDIDFSKRGWIVNVSKLLKVKHRPTIKWVKKHMLEFYNEKCFKIK